MSRNDLFSSDAFAMQTLINAINSLPYKPSRIAQLGIFEESGIATTECSIEFKQNQIHLISTISRGAPAPVYQSGKRDLIPFKVPHLITRSTLLADSIQNVRDFASGQQVALQDAINERLQGMRNNLDATIEYHRMGAIQGIVMDSSGDVLFDTFAEFDVKKQTHALELSNSATNVRNQVVAARRKSEAVLGNAVPTGWIALCSAELFDAVVSHSSVEAFAAGWSAAAMLRDDVRDSFALGGVAFEEYVGTVDGKRFIAPGKGYLVPMGVAGLFISRYGPADYAETVNSYGLPYYAKSEPMPFDRGTRMEAQTNPINLCTRPDAVIELSL